MTRIVLQYIGQLHGQSCYAPMDQDDIKAIGGRKLIIADIKGKKATRTTLQNRAIHKFLALLSEALNAAGWDMKRTLTKQADIPWNPDTAKEWLWRPIQKAMFSKDSTANLETDEVSKVYDTLNRHTSAKLGVSVPFPEKHWNAYMETDDQ